MSQDKQDMLDEYVFSKGVRGKYAKRETSKNLLQFRKIVENAGEANIKVPPNIDIDKLIDKIYDDT